MKLLTSLEVFRVAGMGEWLARVDTGAALCSLHVEQLDIGEGVARFRIGKEWRNVIIAGKKSVRSTNGVLRRATVLLEYSWNGTLYGPALTTLTDRSSMKYPLLIGRSLIRQMNMPVYINEQDRD